jgi:hypothetical protein
MPTNRNNRNNESQIIPSIEGFIRKVTGFNVCSSRTWLGL